MSLNIKKCIDAAVMPIILIVIVDILSSILLTFMPTLAWLFGIPILIVNLILLAWAGYRSVKEANSGISGSAFTGFVAGAVSVIIFGIFVLVLDLLGMKMLTSGIPLRTFQFGSSRMVRPYFGLIIGMIVIVAGIFVRSVFGFVFGAFGGFLAGKNSSMKIESSPQENKK